MGGNGGGCVPPVCPRPPPRVSQRRYPGVGGEPAGSAAASWLNKGAIASLLITPPGCMGGGAGQLSPGPCGLGGRGGAMLMKGACPRPRGCSARAAIG